MAYPNELVKVPPFQLWIAIDFAKDMLASLDIVPNVISIVKPSSNLSATYQSMWAFGNHLQVANAKHILSTIDSRVVATFEQECHSHSNDQNPMLASLEYILGGWKKS